MSALMCSDRHLTALAAYAVRHGLSDVRLPDYPSRDEMRQAIRTTLGVLARENVESLDTRYPNDAMRPVAAVDPTALAAGQFPLLHIIKACHFYAYQSCEHPGWEASRAKVICDRIEAHAVHSLPGYNEAPWGLDEPTRSVPLGEMHDNRCALLDGGSACNCSRAKGLERR